MTTGDVEVGPITYGTSPAQKIVDLVRAERDAWIGRNDGNSSVWARIDEFWRVVGIPDGRERNLPWSGAFIAWAANQAVPGSLPKHAMHSSYAQASLNETRPHRFRTLPPSTPVELGDLVIKPMPGESHEFSDLLQVPFAPFTSHGDFVTAIEGDSVEVTGGNKRHAVASDRLTLNPDGTIPNHFAVMRLNPGDGAIV